MESEMSKNPTTIDRVHEVVTKILIQRKNGQKKFLLVDPGINNSGSELIVSKIKDQIQLYGFTKEQKLLSQQYHGMVEEKVSLIPPHRRWELSGMTDHMGRDWRFGDFQRLTGTQNRLGELILASYGILHLPQINMLSETQLNKLFEILEKGTIPYKIIDHLINLKIDTTIIACCPSLEDTSPEKNKFLKSFMDNDFCVYFI